MKSASTGKSRLNILLAMLFGIFLLPYGYEQVIGLGSANHILRWALWIFVSSFYSNGFAFVGWIDLVVYSPYWIARFLFAFGVIRYYSGKISKRQTIVIGAISVLPALGLSVYSIISSVLQSSGFSMMLYPIPTFFIIVLVLLHFRPYHGTEEPW